MAEGLRGRDFTGAQVPSETRPNVVFTLTHRLGTGGTGSAWYALRRAGDGESPAVIKLIHPEVAQRSGDAARVLVQKEAVSLGRLNERVPPTPFVIRFLDTGAVPWVRGPQDSPNVTLPWLAIEYVHGGPEGTRLEDRVEHCMARLGHAFDPYRAGRAVRHMCEGLAEVHAVDVIHRDLKPNNILCCGYGEQELFKLSDFGISRPEGLSATLGPGMHGTMGYAAPEQIMAKDREQTPATDVFGLTATLYFLLTGSDLFNTASPVALIESVKAPTRPSIASCKGLHGDIAKDRDTVAALDEAIARGTAFERDQRFQSARAFAAAVLPWLSPHLPRVGMMPTEPDAPALVRRPSSAGVALSLPPMTAASPTTINWQWTIRRPPTGDRVITSVAWDADGHALAATDQGLAFWDGAEWLPAPSEDIPFRDQIRTVRRLGAGRWVLAGARGALAEYSRSGVTRIVRGPDDSAVFTNASGDVGDLAVVVAEGPGRPPTLCGISGGRWLRPLPVTQARAITSIARVEDARWLVVGRDTHNNGFIALYEPLMWELNLLTAPEARAYLAVGGNRERGLFVVVGSDGQAVRIERGTIVARARVGDAALASVAVDPLQRTWVGGAGALWLAGDDNEGWAPVWTEPSWQVPFVSLHADPGRVLAMTADGAVLEGRALSIRASSLPPPM